MKFFRTADAFRIRRREGPYRFTQKRSRTFVAPLQSVAAVQRSKNQLARYPAQRTARAPPTGAGGLRHALPKSPDPQILRRSLPLVGHFLIADLCTLIECAEPSFLDRGDMHENILTAVIGLDESITLCRVEPLHRSSCHLDRLPYPIGPRDNLVPIWKASKKPGVSRRGRTMGWCPPSCQISSN